MAMPHPHPLSWPCLIPILFHGHASSPSSFMAMPHPHPLSWPCLIPILFHGHASSPSSFMAMPHPGKGNIQGYVVPLYPGEALQVLVHVLKPPKLLSYSDYLLAALYSDITTIFSVAATSYMDCPNRKMLCLGL